jgi:hypothetical protein
MGRIVTPKYRVEYQDQQGKHIAAWRDGKPTDAKAEAYRVGLNESYKPGKPNAHIPKALGFIPHTSAVVVVCQKTNEVVARAKMPMFEVV